MTKIEIVILDVIYWFKNQYYKYVTQPLANRKIERERIKDLNKLYRRFKEDYKIDPKDVKRNIDNLTINGHSIKQTDDIYLNERLVEARRKLAQQSKTNYSPLFVNFEEIDGHNNDSERLKKPVINKVLSDELLDSEKKLIFQDKLIRHNQLLKEKQTLENYAYFKPKTSSLYSNLYSNRQKKDSELKSDKI